MHGSLLLALTHWGRMTHICVSKLTIIGSDIGLSPGRHQAIIWTNAGIFFQHWTPRNKFQWHFNRNPYLFIQENSFESVVWKMAAMLYRPQCVNTIASQWDILEVAELLSESSEGTRRRVVISWLLNSNTKYLLSSQSKILQLRFVEAANSLPKMWRNFPGPLLCARINFNPYLDECIHPL